MDQNRENRIRYQIQCCNQESEQLNSKILKLQHMITEKQKLKRKLEEELLTPSSTESPRTANSPSNGITMSKQFG